ncbi:MAG: ABC transporter substrate-binding protein [Alphaproteobacteria bacterium]|nr:ABC transporter substrate-binding protein [Alphaproteobacteria bacterium]
MTRLARPGRLARALALATGLLATPAVAQDLTIGTKLELNTLDPHFFNGFPSGSSLAMFFNRLVEFDENLAPQPGLALSWRNVDDTTWEFKLRPGVVFHDGAPFTADDVIATFARVPAVPNSPNSFSQFTRPVKELVKVDDLTVQMRTHQPHPTLLSDLDSVFIVGKAALNQTTAEFNAGKVNGTGPYRLVEWVNGARLVAERNDRFWGPREPWTKVTERVITRDPARVAALLAGDVDVIDLVPTADLPKLKADARYATFSGPAAIIHYIAMDSARDVSPFVTAKDGAPLARNPLKDPRVRKALSLAINREAIVSRLMEGSAEAASQFLPGRFFGTSQKLRPDAFDLDAARKLLAEAGWPDGFRLVMHSTNDRYPNDIQIAQAIGQTWSRLGLRVEIEGVPGAIFFGRASKQEFSLFIAQFGTIEAVEGPRALVASFLPDKGWGTANRTRYSNPEFDARLGQALGLMDPAQRSAAVASMIEFAMAEQAVIPVFYPAFDFAARKDLRVIVKPQRRAHAMMMKPAN